LVRLALLLPLVIDDQVVKDGLEIAAKAAALGVRVLEVAAHEAQGELLEQLVGDVEPADAGQQVAVDRTPIAFQELLGGAHRLWSVLVRPDNDGPLGGDVAETVVGGFRFHDGGRSLRGKKG